MRYIEFTIRMPNINTWNNRWSGENDDHFLVRRVPEKEFTKGLIGSWYYDFGDGWGASVTSHLVSGDELRRCDQKLSKKRNNFLGYEWMVDEIFKYGRIRTREERHAAETAAVLIGQGSGQEA